jgi:acyl-coenzyme A synthetase/AMP-(fatty) acid ligase
MMSVNLEAANNAASLIIDQHISENTGDHPAIRFREKRYSYHDLAALMNRAGNMMLRLGTKPGDAVLVAIAPSPSLIASIFGAMKIGAVPVLLPSDASSEVLASVSGMQKPKLSIADASRVSELHHAVENDMIVVVGEAAAGQKSFLQEMRESASSLTKYAISNGAVALAIVHADELIFVPHRQLAGARFGTSFAFKFDGWNLGEALGRFARGEEEVIG